ncbi:hypothetical protein PV05_03927 [Exophiala xenobiotica]|uniref:RING-type E3 ubiquitin transferase n=1 Tax=Exophiala xenobiotica TaxID=348802 RepID=A0A0D2EXN5_9EURO|nr:uncharacterized protein PV05_03927 [Exophiala xenobiotica]KIW59480.1 hypothetical protein PV05_03927 [Exophiala xenobiotica]
MPPNLEDNHPVALAGQTASAHTHDAPYEEGQDYCRICRGEGTPSQPLFYPCKCSGSIRFVHQECLMEWLSHSQKKYCELCKTSFRFTKLYDRSMPATLPLPLFIGQLVRHGVKGVLRWTRYVIVGLIWICCLPWCIRQIWRGMIWFADGNWLDEEQMQLMTATTSNMTSTVASNMSLDAFALNFTMPEYLERIKLVFPPMQLSLADIARIFLSRGLVGRVFQLFLSIFMPGLGEHPRPVSSSNMTLPLGTVRRPPSLLSEVEFLATLTDVPAVNSICIDVVEGQLICISLVTAFILVFLIREWVINQQPNLNMPDPDLADAAEDARNEIPEQQPTHPAPPEENHDVAVQGPVQRPIAIPRLRRVVTDDNILNDTGTVLARPNFTARSQSVGHDNTQESEPEISIGESSAIADDTEPRPVRRHSLSNSILVQRGFEVTSAPEAAHRERFPVYFDNSTSSDEPEFFDARQLAEIDAQDVDASSSMATHSGSRRVSFKTNADTVGEDSESRNWNRIGAIEDETDSEGVIIPTPASSDAGQPNQTVEATTVDSPGSSTSNQEPHGEEGNRLSWWEEIARWLWPAENFDNVQVLAEAQLDAAEGGQDDEEIMEDALAGAPFVPNHHRDPLPQPQAPAVDAADVPGHQPNIVLGVDLNDPNAAEDIEDLDGVLELLGMEGPIFGMIQNVIFSLFLITITLSASVWCPYIWGKIALLFMHNPVMLIKAPLLVLSTTADMAVDVFFFVAGLGGFILNQPLKIIKAIISPFLPALTSIVDPTFLEGFTLDLSQKSGARLEKTLSGAILNLKPDLPTFSIMAHHALVSYKASFRDTVQWAVSAVSWIQDVAAGDSRPLYTMLERFGPGVRSAPQFLAKLPQLMGPTLDAIRTFPQDLITTSGKPSFEVDQSLVEWSTEDRIITILIGYAFFAAAGVLFMEFAHMIMGLNHNEKVEGYLADSLRQAGGVMKVIVIIGLEMLLFPLYCGLLLDVALLPLFADATIAGRFAFIARAPFTGVFIHWFIGTCYMFHFALFVSICRKIMRTGVLYFIRDPDDPTFHPVRDVLERPVPAQLGKIAFSALVYGGLVIVCLGGVVWTLSCVPGVLPIQWATPEPRLAFPVDILFYNFMLRYVLRMAEPSKKISAVYKWWFRGCARSLRLTNFLFGEEAQDETYSTTNRLWGLFTGKKASTALLKDGTYVRAPASDSVRIPKGRNVFLPVNEQNERIDGQPDVDFGNHGKKDTRFTKVYLPPRFGARISTFVFLLWVFAATTGVAFTIGPLLLGRLVLYFVTQSSLPPNDLYAFTTGVQILAVVGYAIAYARPALDYVKSKIPQSSWSQVIGTAKYVLGLVYLLSFTALVLPFVLSLILELYIHIPLVTYMAWHRKGSSPGDAATINHHIATIFILQSWVIGLLYSRLLYRQFLLHMGPGSRISTTLYAITRNGVLKPDVRLASRAFVLPVTVVCLALLGGPLFYAKAIIMIAGIQDQEVKIRLYRFAYPSALGLLVTWLGMLGVKQQVASWRARIRDEVYLIGERLHNFSEPKPDKVVKGKAKVKDL